MFAWRVSYTASKVSIGLLRVLVALALSACGGGGGAGGGPNTSGGPTETYAVSEARARTIASTSSTCHATRR